MIWKVKNREISCDKTLLMGVLNVTPDSFSDGGKFLASEKAVARALRMVAEGADILDLGGESTRPGAAPISAEEELSRILPVLKVLRSKISIPISIDTTKAVVAKTCLEEGAHIINDVSALAADEKMAGLVCDHRAGLILMHRRGDPQTMQSLADYGDVVAEVLTELRGSIDNALSAGIDRDQIVMDPGLGFAKTAEQNLKILSELEKFVALGFPVLLGPSRKSFIGKITGREVGDREYGTAAVAAVAVTKGIRILRVHEIGPARDAIRMAEAIQGVSHVRSL